MSTENRLHQSYARLGVLGGTFDPIHYAHLFLAEQAREQLGLCAVQFIPSARPPHKRNDPVSDAEHRYNMCCLATQDNPDFSVSRRELDRPGPSFTAVSLRELRDEGHQEIYFITGADTILEMKTWREPEVILKQFHVVAAARPGFDLSQIIDVLGPDLAAGVHLIETPELPFASTDIRQKVANGQSVRYCTPPAVIDYLNQHNLYTSDAIPGETDCPEHGE